MRYLLLFFSIAAVGCAGADLSATVGFPSSPEAQGCSPRRTDGYTAACTATLNGTLGVAMMNQYAVGGRSHVTSGAIATTIPATSGTTVKASASITFTEFSNIKQPLVIKNRCTKDCEPVTVTVNGTEVGVLTGKDQLVAPYDGTAFYTVEVSVLRTETEVGRDYAGYWNVLVGPGR